MPSDFRGGALGLLYSILSVCMVLRCSQKFVTITVLVLSSLHTWQLGTTNIPKTHWGSSPSVKQVAVHHTRLYKIFLLSRFFVSIWPPTSNQKLWVTFRCMQFRNFQAVRELEIENCKNPLFWKLKKISVTLQRYWQKSAYWQKYSSIIVTESIFELNADGSFDVTEEVKQSYWMYGYIIIR